MTGRYAMERPLGGEGGLAWLATDKVLGRPVVLRFFAADGVSEDDRRACARTAALLSHPGLATLLDMGDDAERGLYIVFEHVEGPTLRARLSEGAMAADAVKKLASDLTAALAAAHGAGSVHGRLRPEDVVLSRTGPRITGVGVARAGGGDAAADRAALAAMLPAIISEISVPAEEAPVSATPNSLLPRRRTRRIQNLFAAAGLLVIVALVAFGKRTRERTRHDDTPDAASAPSTNAVRTSAPTRPKPSASVDAATPDASPLPPLPPP